MLTKREEEGEEHSLRVDGLLYRSVGARDLPPAQIGISNAPPSTRRRAHIRIGSMAWRLTKVHAICYFSDDLTHWLIFTQAATQPSLHLQMESLFRALGPELEARQLREVLR